MAAAVDVVGGVSEGEVRSAASDNADPAFLNLSVAPNRTDPFSGNLRIFDTSRDNAQLRLFRLSAWETISQIYRDPKTANEFGGPS